MRIFLAGAIGVIGRNLVPILVKTGHEVAGMTRRPANADALIKMGAEPIICDAFDQDRLTVEIEKFQPDIIINQLTDLPNDAELIRSHSDSLNKIRVQGTANLITASKGLRDVKLISQSADWELPGRGGEAITELEKMTLANNGIVLRYGQFYGPGTYHETSKPGAPAIEISEAARATADAIKLSSGIYEVTDISYLKPIEPSYL